MSFFSCLGGPKNEEVSRTGEFPLSVERGAGAHSPARLGWTRAGRDLLELGRSKVLREGLTLHILSTALEIYAKYPSTPKHLETGKEKGIYEVKTPLKEKLKNSMNFAVGFQSLPAAFKPAIPFFFY